MWLEIFRITSSITTLHLATKDPVSVTIPGGANYTTNLYLATMSKPTKPTLNLFIKLANLNEETREKNEVVSKVYLVESLFYTQLAAKYERLYEKNKVPLEDRLLIPKYYAHDLTRLEEILVLEDLEASGYENFDRMKTFDWEYAAAAVQSMARLHALGLALKDEDPSEFEDLVRHFEVDFLKNQEATTGFMTEIVANGCAVLEPEYAMKLGKFFSCVETVGKLTKLVVDDKTMLIHGDFRPSNLMHRERVSRMPSVLFFCH